ncbi:hypothetical protein GOP47_0014789 [Adiantum capillus-veneris]|uniref:Phytocyanin domain-containing protein n=1 Tax=Adiantum capillus-veneris TaxID=13818 RepID=A0A9D4UM86_ADICA|nr:hypothetical protein GOP47_0014789 [Adiantum capillus-veneris]
MAAAHAGRGSAHAALLLALACLHEAAYGATHTVGGSRGWDLGVDYTNWAAGVTFKVGDVLFFPYTQTVHNVVVVNKAGYDACSDANAITTLSAGNDNVTLTTAGTHYYLCSVVGHCSGGMKLTVMVAAAAAAAPASTPTGATALSPIATPSSAPSPINTEPSQAPASAPTETPASAPAVTAPASGPAGSPATSPVGSSVAPTTNAGAPPSPPPPNAAPSLPMTAAAAGLTLQLMILAFLLAL